MRFQSLTKYFWLKNLDCKVRITVSSEMGKSKCMRSFILANRLFFASSKAIFSRLATLSSGGVFGLTAVLVKAPPSPFKFKGLAVSTGLVFEL